MSNAAAIVGQVYYSGNSFDPHMDRVDAVDGASVRVTYIGRAKSGGPLAKSELGRNVPADVFAACYYTSYAALIAARVDGPAICGMLRATLPGER